MQSQAAAIINWRTKLKSREFILFKNLSCFSIKNIYLWPIFIAFFLNATKKAEREVCIVPQICDYSECYVY